MSIDEILNRINTMIDENEELIRENQRIIGALHKQPESRPECRVPACEPAWKDMVETVSCDGFFWKREV